MVKRIRIHPTDGQKQILYKWFSCFRWMFTMTNRYIRDHLMDRHGVPKMDKKESLKFLNYLTIQPELVQEKGKYTRDGMPSHFLDDAIDHCIAKYITSIKNYFSGYCDNFYIRDWEFQKSKEILLIEPQAFSKVKNAFCTTVLGIMQSDHPIMGIKSAAQLVYDRNRNSWTLMITGKITGKKIVTSKNAHRKCGCDPGVRTFMTVYSPNAVYDIGENTQSAYKPLMEKIDHINTHFDAGLLTKRKAKCATAKRYKRIHNLTTELHCKTAKFLCDRYDKIVIGKFSTKSCVSNNKKEQLHPMTKRIMYALRHYDFRQRLINAGEKYGSLIVEGDEHKTTVTCSACGHEQYIGSSKVYSCESCGVQMDRDANSGRNLYGRY
jgi:putative transposase